MKIAVLLAEGFEIAEAMCPADVFRRAGLDTVLISVSDSKEVRSSCGIIVTADKTINEAEDEDFNAVFCPGGMPGSVNLSQSWEAGRMIVKTAQSGIVAAICAAPAAVLYPLGILDGRNATCYPGCESFAPDFRFSSEGVIRDGNIITGKSAGWAFDLGLEVIAALVGKENFRYCDLRHGNAVGAPCGMNGNTELKERTRKGLYRSGGVKNVLQIWEIFADFLFGERRHAPCRENEVDMGSFRLSCRQLLFTFDGSDKGKLCLELFFDFFAVNAFDVEIALR